MLKESVMKKEKINLWLREHKANFSLLWKDPNLLGVIALLSYFLFIIPIFFLVPIFISIVLYASGKWNFSAIEQEKIAGFLSFFQKCAVIYETKNTEKKISID